MPASALAQRIIDRAIIILGEYYNFIDVWSNFIFGDTMECLLKKEAYQLVEAMKESAVSLEDLSRGLAAIQQLIIHNDELAQPVLRFQIAVIEELRRGLIDFSSLDTQTIDDFFTGIELLSTIEFQRGVFVFDEESLLGLRKILLHQPQQSIPFMQNLFGDAFIPQLIAAAYEPRLLNQALDLMREASIDFNLLQCFENQLNQQPLLVKTIEHAPERFKEVLRYLKHYPEEQRETILLSTYPNHYSGLLYKAIDKNQGSILALVFESLRQLPSTPKLKQYTEKQLTLVLGNPFHEGNTRLLLDYLIQNNQLHWILQILQLPLLRPGESRLSLIASHSPLLFQRLLTYAETVKDNHYQKQMFQRFFESAAQTPSAAKLLIHFIVSSSICRERWYLMHTNKNQNIIHIAAEHAPEEIQRLMNSCKLIIPHKFAQLMAQPTQNNLFTPLLVAVEHQPTAVPFLLNEIYDLDNARKILLHIGRGKSRVFNAMTLAELCGSPSTSQLISEAVKRILIPAAHAASSSDSSFFAGPSLAKTTNQFAELEENPDDRPTACASNS